MSDARILEIIRILKDEDDFLSADSLAERIGVRPRTLREMMRQVRTEAEDKIGGSLVYKYNYGYRLLVPDRQKLERYMAEQTKAEADNRYIMPETSEERCDYIIRGLLMNRTAIKSDDILDQMYISRSTLAADLKLVRAKLKRYNLSLDSRSGEGLLIVGDEHQIRACISDFFFYDDFAQSSIFREQPIALFGSHYEQKVTAAVMEVLEKHNYHMTDVGINNLKVHILIALFRIRNHETVPQRKPLIDEERFAEEFMMSSEIRDRIYDETKIRISDDELGYMVVHMVGTRIFTENDANMISPDTINIVRAVLTQILNETGIDFFHDIELFTMLSTHMEPMLNRICNHVKMRNPMLERIKKENHKGFDIALIATEMISRIYHAEVDENETAYLALHFELALRRRNEINKKRILTVCASGAGTSRLLKYNLMQNFSSSIESIDSAGLAEMMHTDLSKYDLIISTVPLQLKLPVPVIVVQYYLSEEDKDVINRKLRFNTVSSASVADAFHRNLYFEHMSFLSRNEVIHFLCTQMANDISVPADFEAKVMQREIMASTAMGGGVAVPHPSVVMLEDTRIAVCHLDTPVIWHNGEKVNWVFLMGMKKNNGAEGEMLTTILFRMINDEEIMSDLNEHPEYVYFIEKVKTLLSMKETEKQESIFQ